MRCRRWLPHSVREYWVSTETWVLSLWWLQYHINIAGALRGCYTITVSGCMCHNTVTRAISSHITISDRPAPPPPLAGSWLSQGEGRSTPTESSITPLTMIDAGLMRHPPDLLIRQRPGCAPIGRRVPVGGASLAGRGGGAWWRDVFCPPTPQTRTSLHPARVPCTPVVPQYSSIRIPRLLGWLRERFTVTPAPPTIVFSVPLPLQTHNLNKLSPGLHGNTQTTQTPKQSTELTL